MLAQRTLGGNGLKCGVISSDIKMEMEGGKGFSQPAGSLPKRYRYRGQEWRKLMTCTTLLADLRSGSNKVSQGVEGKS